MYFKHSIQIYLVYSVTSLDIPALAQILVNFGPGTEPTLKLNIIPPKPKTTLLFLLPHTQIELQSISVLEILFLVVDTNKTLVTLVQLL